GAELHYGDSRRADLLGLRQKLLRSIHAPPASCPQGDSHPEPRPELARTRGADALPPDGRDLRQAGAALGRPDGPLQQGRVRPAARGGEGTDGGPENGSWPAVAAPRTEKDRCAADFFPALGARQAGHRLEEAASPLPRAVAGGNRRHLRIAC